ncbi:MAG: hypothetical protein EZS28_037442, partial [Streblomastix strix]
MIRTPEQKRNLRYIVNSSDCTLPELHRFCAAASKQSGTEYTKQLMRTMEKQPMNLEETGRLTPIRSFYSTPIIADRSQIGLQSSNKRR